MPLNIGHVFALGVNHNTAPLDVRERLALDGDGVQRHLKGLLGGGLCEEALIVSTCNRVELFGVAEENSVQSVFDYFCRISGGRGVAEHLFQVQGREAVVHLFRVASSLDSLVLGEPQILGQVKDAIRLAEESQALGNMMRPLTRRSLTLAKRVRNETDIGRSKVGVGSASVDLAKQIFGDLGNRRAMLIGVGEMGQEVARTLQRAGLEELVVVNRTFERAVEFAQQVAGTPVPFNRLAEYLPRVDICITATSAQGVLVKTSDVRAALKARRYRPLFLMDLAVPRNIEPSVDRLDAAYLYNVDDLSGIVEEGRRAREVASSDALKLVEAEADRFLSLMQELDVAPAIGLLIERMEALRSEEVARSRRLLGDLSLEQQADLDALTKGLIKKVLHRPLTNIKSAARTGDYNRAKTVLEAWEEEQ
jgi:glutamyl-tRNA reductase